MSRVASIYLSKKEHDRFMRVCEKEGCTRYALAKKALLDHIWNYPLEGEPAPEEGRETEAPTPETSVEEAEDSSTRLRKLLQGEST